MADSCERFRALRTKRPVLRAMYCPCPKAVSLRITAKWGWSSKARFSKHNLAVILALQEIFHFLRLDLRVLIPFETSLKIAGVLRSKVCFSFDTTFSFISGYIRGFFGQRKGFLKSHRFCRTEPSENQNGRTALVFASSQYWLFLPIFMAFGRKQPNSLSGKIVWIFS